MADYTPIHPAGLLPRTSTASAAVSGGDLVAVSGTGTVGPASQGAAAVGVAAHDAGVGTLATIHPLAGVVHELIAGSGGVTAGQVVMVGADPAEVLPLDEGVAVGVALTAASAEARVQVLGVAVGDHTHSGLMTGSAPEVDDSTAAALEDLVADFNALLEALRDRGVIGGGA